MYKLDLEKAGEPESNFQHLLDHRESKGIPGNIYFCFIAYAKDFDCVDHNKLWNILEEMGIPDHLSCFLRNLYAGQEATVRTEDETMDWFKIGKGVRQGCILSGFPCSSVCKHSVCNAGDPGSIPVLGRSPGEGNGNPVQYSCLENSVDRGAWQATSSPWLTRVYCHSAYLTYMQSTSSEMLCWMTQKLESRLLGEISTTSNM